MSVSVATSARFPQTHPATSRSSVRPLAPADRPVQRRCWTPGPRICRTGRVPALAAAPSRAR
jgi:hypothetical protein